MFSIMLDVAQKCIKNILLNFRDFDLFVGRMQSQSVRTLDNTCIPKVFNEVLQSKNSPRHSDYEVVANLEVVLCKYEYEKFPFKNTIFICYR